MSRKLAELPLGEGDNHLNSEWQEDTRLLLQMYSLKPKK